MKLSQKITIGIYIGFFCSALYATDFEVTFETTNCNGDTGFTVVNVADIYRIETIKCEGAGDEQKFKQVMINSRSYVSSFDIFTVTAEEAKQIQTQVRRYVDAKRRALETGSSIIIHK